MADGIISISVEVDGKEITIAADELEKLGSSGVKGGEGAKEAEEGLKAVGQESGKASGNVKKFATALGLIAIGATAFKVLRDSMDDAISRFDTLNTFPKIMQELGVSAEDSQKSMDKLWDGIVGLPTKLDDIASTAQRMYTSFGDMDKATDSALALNNALLGSGASSEQAKRGTEQYLKALQTGKFDMDTWNTLSETMDVGLVKVAESFGYAGKSAKNDLYNALQDGSVTIDQFNDKLIEIGTGTGDMARLAKENSLGLATSLANLKTSVSRNMASVIESFNNLSKEITGKEIAEHIDGLSSIIDAAFTVVRNVIKATIPVFKGIKVAMIPVLAVAKALSPILIGIATTMGILATGLIAVRAAMLAKAAAAKILGTSLKSMMGPLGWVATGIGALGGAVAGIVKWFNKASDAEKQLTSETEELTKEVSELNNELEQSSEQHKKNVTDIEGTEKSNRDLMGTIQELSEKENKSATDRALLKTYTDQLNESVEGLNLSYDEHTDSLNMTNEEMGEYVQLMKDQETLEESQNRMVEVTKERNAAEEKLEEINKDRKEWNEHLENGGKKGKEAKEAIEALDAEEKILTETNADLAKEYGDLQDVITETTTSINNNSVAQMQQLQELLEEHEDVFNDIKEEYDSLAEAASDAFDRISDESKYSMEEMIANLEHNQEMVDNWGDNIAELMEYASKNSYDGFMEYLDTLTIDQAAELQEMVDSSDDELKTFAELHERAGDKASDNLNKKLGKGFEDVVGLMAGLPGEGADVLRSNAKRAGFDKIGGEMSDDVRRGLKEKSITLLSGASQIARSVEGRFGGISLSGAGVNAMSGLKRGLNNGRSGVMATATSIANSVASTVRGALQIHSPSRVMEELGGFAGEGLAVGLEGMRKSVIDASESLANASIPSVNMSAPETALGLNGNSAMRLGNSTINNYSSGGGSPSPKTVTNNSKPTIHIEKIENHSDSDIPKILEESAWIMSREDKRL